MQTKGKTVLFLGDSITEGCGASDYQRCWASLVANEGEFGTAVNYGVGGTRIANQRLEKNPDWAESFCQRLERMQAEADLILVAGGTNDYGHGDAPFGEFGDREPDTFYGAVDFLLRSLIERYPTARIGLCTPIHRTEEDRKINEFGYRNCKSLPDYVEAEKRVCEKYAIPVLDLYRVSGICPENEVNRATYTTDGLHPNDLGHRRLADLILQFIHNTL